MTSTAGTQARTLRKGRSSARVDFTQPRGEAALCAADSVSWRVFKNPVALYIGGIAAVLLELAEPRVRTGVWEHTTFRDDPLPRMRRTGLAAMVTVYGPRSVAQEMIAGVTRLHAGVHGVTPQGQSYHALEPELMDWVQATASFGFLQAYHHYVLPLSAMERDSFYAESQPAAALYGAPGAPTSEAQQVALFAAMQAQLVPHPIVLEFLEIMRATPALPWPFRPLQTACINAAILLLPEAIQTQLHIQDQAVLSSRQRRWIRMAAALAERIPIPATPPVQACRRMGLPGSFLFRPKPRVG